ncbi:MAG: DsbA family protein [Pseudomonadota bacterium]
MDQLRIYFHFRSPYSRLGLHVVARAGITEAVDTLLIPFTAPAGGAPFLNPTDSMPKMRYIAEDAPRMAERMGLVSTFPRPMDPDYTPALNAFYQAREAGAALPFTLALSDARFSEGLNISDPKLLSSIAVDHGLREDAMAQAVDPSTVEQDQAMVDRDRVFGVTFAVLEKDGKKQRFWGHDRFELLVELIS